MAKQVVYAFLGLNNRMYTVILTSSPLPWMSCFIKSLWGKKDIKDLLESETSHSQLFYLASSPSLCSSVSFSKIAVWIQILMSSKNHIISELEGIQHLTNCLDTYIILKKLIYRAIALLHEGSSLE